jgi:uncharacterized protein involved in type VI secretion and phage assembly
MSSAHDSQGVQGHSAAHLGVVVDNKDPKKLGRCRIRVPGLVEPASNWALPIGGLGGGVKGRGSFAAPKEGSDVVVMFLAGDVDAPVYFGGHYGEEERPAYLDEENVAEADTHLVYVHETDRYEVVIDSRPGKGRLRLRDKKTNDEILMDGAKGGINISATSLVNIEAKGGVNIDGNAVTICERPVIRNGKPIQ